MFIAGRRIFTACLFVASVGLTLAGCDSEPKEQSEQVPNEVGGKAQPVMDKHVPPAAPLGMLVSAEELQSRLNDESLRVLDARSIDDYITGHVPGALFVDVGEWKEQSLSENGLKDTDFWSDRVGGLGITRESPVVVYGDDPTAAARVWWTLKYVGVPNVALLDGGWQAWTKMGGEVSEKEAELTDDPRFRPDFQKDRLAEIGDVKQSLAAEKVTVLDARSDEEYTGISGPGERQGHLPGAVHLEWKRFLDEDGRFKSPEQIRELLAEKGITGEKPVVTHCQSGGRASLEVFALELAGIPNVRNYYCGWSEWSGDAEAPVEK